MCGQRSEEDARQTKGGSVDRDQGAKSEDLVPSDHDSDGIPSSAVPSDHSSAVPSDEDTPPSSAVPSDHDSDVLRPPDFAERPGISLPLNFVVKELGPLLQDTELKSCGCQRS